MNKKHYLIFASIVATFGIITVWLGQNLNKIPFLASVDPVVIQALVMIIGILAAGVTTWIMTRGEKKSQDGGRGAGTVEPAEFTGMDELLSQTEARLAAAHQEKDSKLGKLPVIILLGEPGSAKTTTMVQSGTAPEALAGQVFEQNQIVPTPAANFWFADHTVFVEMGGKLLGDTEPWKRLASRLQPPQAAALLGTAPPVPRAALVCVDAEVLLSPSPDPLAMTAHKLRTQLGETAHLLGIHLPVYVLFTRGDRLPFFVEYFSRLNNEEATRILGCTLPVVTEYKGVYAEEESARLSVAFEKLFRKMCNARPIFLVRERDPMTLAAMYLFPREFRRIHQNLVRFLVELCRPSQITVGPFLRGFYFSGVRPIMVDEVAPTAPLAPAGPGAAGMFGGQGLAAAAQHIVGQRRAPQWLFLSHLFKDQMLADAAAKDASSSRVGAGGSRRTVFSVVSLLCLIYSVLLLFSYRNNSDLADNVKQAAQTLAATPTPAGGEAPSLDSLKNLDALRLSIGQLAGGAPLSYHWGLYIGSDLYDPAHKVYFDHFCRVLFGPAKETIAASLNGLPASAPENDKFGYPYKSLKAYLEVTRNPERATADFLPPVLLDRWAAPRNVDPARRALAQKQFEFYTDELIYATRHKIPLPCGSDSDDAAIAHAQDYLAGNFEGEAWVLGNGHGKPAVTSTEDPLTSRFLSDINTSGKYISYDIHFDTDLYLLKPESIPVLQKIAAGLAKDTSMKVEIDGYTDSVGGPAHNLPLSQNRADAVRSELVSLGVEASRLTSKGFGAANPIGTNDSADGRALNRRVEFVKK